MSWEISGMSALCALGDTVAGIHRALCSGRSGPAPLTAFDTSKYRAKAAYEVPDRARPDVDEPLRATRWLVRVVREALADAGLPHPDPGLPVLVGTTHRELRTAELWWRYGGALSPADLHFTAALRAAVGLRDVTTVASACAASLYGLGMATDLIALGEADTVVVAGTDSIPESSFGGFDRIQFPPPDTIRAFDRSRRGMVMGEGAVAVVLRRAGAHPGRIHGRVLGVSMNCDAAHPTAPDSAGIVRAVEEAHGRASVAPDDIDLVIVHGSGTAQSDLAEAVALRDVFKAADPGPLVTAIKGGMGHISGGAGLLNLVVALEAIRSGTVPAISGLTDPIEEAGELRVVSGRPATGPFGTAQVHAVGMGGINAVAIVEGAGR
ncbi:beta-ketoacyl-[acyl-carrier-protein] synthase family protein [Streptomyces spectabilis]|uniref:3-oxoacyl-ACP synthase n=1 Tax=Streptomyces spectabilis TaxID=68270 RepID=A0A5P2X587_STRST|nr:beta-ketoacyl synthase N-terminal-like domain-containing protein [Streptomyces spectabilis]MBB5101459.1 3-oxoacyl-[acyl-carrier-protein] synthase II [Streptomyces spectabilis]MCI3900651.1 3-oxoacyl-ACP synthase [Streptomyces spectabilis]QEV58200.1 3-oxoacyl-ACP synthase [Streptomyces spectabilis]GGV11560.1 3-oxoacyl-ACP synthase [Streptomyces spectabilis]